MRFRVEKKTIGDESLGKGGELIRMADIGTGVGGQTNARWVGRGIDRQMDRQSDRQILLPQNRQGDISHLHLWYRTPVVLRCLASERKEDGGHLLAR